MLPTGSLVFFTQMILISANIEYGSILGSDRQWRSHWQNDAAVCLLVAIS
jgi:hypothetical protein